MDNSVISFSPFIIIALDGVNRNYGVTGDARDKKIHRKTMEQKYQVLVPEFLRETELLLSNRYKSGRTRIKYDTFGNPYETEIPMDHALYRHSWRRAIVLSYIAATNGNKEDVEKFQYFESVCGNLYYERAPEGLYGKAKLQFTGDAQSRLEAFERERIEEAQEKISGIKKKKYRGAVYLVYSPGNQQYKIGRTTQAVKKRLSGLRTGNPDIELVHEIPTDFPEYLETKLHGQFDSKRIQREWFALSEIDVGKIKNYRAKS